MKNYKIGKELTNILKSDVKVTSDVDNKIFPLVANAGTTFPFIVYRRSNYRPNDNKDFLDEIVGVELAVLSDKYEESVNIANNVGDCLENAHTELVEQIKITNIFEDYQEDTFIQKINIDIYIKNN